MGYNVINLYIKADQVRAQDGAALVGLHIDLAIPKNDVSAVRKHLAERRWTDIEEYLMSLYPQHDTIIGTWLDTCRKSPSYKTYNVAPSADVVRLA